MNDKSGLREGFPGNYRVNYGELHDWFINTSITSSTFCEHSRKPAQCLPKFRAPARKLKRTFANFHVLSFRSRKFEVISPIVIEKYRSKCLEIPRDFLCEFTAIIRENKE